MASKKKSPKPARQQRWTVERKTEVVMRLLKGESLDAVSRDTKVSAAKLSEWRDAFIATGKTGLKSRTTDPVAEAAADEKRRLLAKIGELSIEVEILKEGNKILEARSGPFPRKRSRR
jgi:transposase-like protein